MHFTGAEVGRPLLLDEDVQAGVQLCLHQQEGLPDGWGGESWFSRGFQCFPEQAWPYYAAAAELAALSMFMLSSTDPGKGCLRRPCSQHSNVYKYWTIGAGYLSALWCRPWLLSRLPLDPSINLHPPFPFTQHATELGEFAGMFQNYDEFSWKSKEQKPWSAWK